MKWFLVDMICFRFSYEIVIEFSVRELLYFKRRIVCSENFLNFRKIEPTLVYMKIFTAKNSNISFAIKKTINFKYFISVVLYLSSTLSFYGISKSWKNLFIWSKTEVFRGLGSARLQTSQNNCVHVTVFKKWPPRTHLCFL